MADIVVKAAYGSVVEDEGMLFVGFAAGEEEDEGYVLFRQPLGGGPVWFEVSDEAFGAEDAVERVVGGPKGLEIAARLCLNGLERSVTGPVGVTGPAKDCRSWPKVRVSQSSRVRRLWSLVDAFSRCAVGDGRRWRVLGMSGSSWCIGFELLRVYEPRFLSTGPKKSLAASSERSNPANWCWPGSSATP